MNRSLTSKKLATLAVLLILAGVPTALLAFSHSESNHSLNPALIKQPVTGLPQLGFDCGQGATQAVLNGTSFPVAPSEAGTFETLPSCTWIGDYGNYAAAPDGTNEPLVVDQDEVFSSTVSTAVGGGFTVDVVYLQNSTSQTNGFDMLINWNPRVLQMVKFDQNGLPWNTFSPFTQQASVDNSVGQFHVVQVIFVHVGGDIVFFRLR
ncbi:hypothetical protein E6H36_12880, partial [Candidatus Bathyarchaeota archaeon]